MSDERAQITREDVERWAYQYRSPSMPPMSNVHVARLAQFALDVLNRQNLTPAGGGWCPVHGAASCPEQYMLMRDGRPAPGYERYWSDGLWCGQRQLTYRLALTGRSTP